ncbi:uncharacterized protein [Arachis hypogaea]|uniref:uncharacterized protein n=1 Tax=Arachis hypogaea TaxID=3818 RepID=UPI000DED2198|nr:uncharacterized protein LOC112794958 [Arachis hypogaea]
MDFVTGLPRTRSGFDAIWVIVERLTKSAHFLPIRISCSMDELARLYIKEIVRLHGVPSSIVSDHLVAETAENIKKIRARMLTAQSRQKSYADQRRKPLEFEVGEHVFLRVTLTTGIRRAIKTKKLNLRYIGPFEILRRFGPVAYQVALPLHLSNLHDIFHVSQLRKYTSDVAHVLEPELVELRENLTFQLTQVRIDDTSVKKLRGKEVSLVKVTCERAGVEEHTWELESEMRKDYPELFSGSLSSLLSIGSWLPKLLGKTLDLEAMHAPKFSEHVNIGEGNVVAEDVEISVRIEFGFRESVISTIKSYTISR